MSKSTYGEELRCALDAVRRASLLCQEVAASLNPAALEKRDKSPVTIADFASQAVVGKALLESFADVPLIAEEDSLALRQGEHQDLTAQVITAVEHSLGTPLDHEQVFSWIDHGGARDYSGRFWTLDPIDGTKGFLRSGQYAIALALLVEGEPVVSILGCPNLPNADGTRGALFHASTGQGAWSRPLAGGPDRPIQVSTTMHLEDCRFCESVEAGHSDHDQAVRIAQALGIRSEPIRMDSQAKYATLARGDAEIYLRLPTRAGYVERIWDHAAGYGLLRAAGGRITDIHGAELDFKHGAGLSENRGVVASHGPAHERILRAVADEFHEPTT